MRIFIDSNTFPASPAIYADAERKKPLPRIIPLVQGFRGEIEVCFLGELAPKPGDGLTLAMRPYGAGADVVRTETVAVVAGAEAGVAASAKVSLAVNTDALQAAIGTRETLNVLCGIVVTDDAAAFPTRLEWQVVFAIAASALPNGVPAPEISPSAVDVLRDEINAVKIDLAKNYVDLNSSQDVAVVKSFLQGINIGSSANPFGVPDWRIASGGITYFGGGMSMPGNTKILPQGVSSDVVSARAVKGLTSSAGEILIPAKTGTFALVSDVESAVGKALTSAYRYAGQVPTEADLPESANNGDVYDVADTGKNYAYDAKLGRWDALGGTINYATEAELQALQSAVEAKADDADVVHKSGMENISGRKNFLQGISALQGVRYVDSSGNSVWTSFDRNTETGGVNFTFYGLNPDCTYSFPYVINGALATVSTVEGLSDGSITNLSVLPLGTTTALGAPAYGLHVSATGGLQLFGTHFLNGDIWTDDSVKMVKGNVSLTSTDTASIGFDYANNVIFRTMPNDGTEATYKLEAWQWDDDSHTTKSPSAGVKLLKPSQKTELKPDSVPNVSEGDKRWGKIDCPAWTLSVADGAMLDQPLQLRLVAESTGGNFGLEIIEVDGTSYRILFPFRPGQIALTSDVPDVSGKADKNRAELGSGANAEGAGSVAIGDGATCVEMVGVAIGSGATASGNCAIALGYKSTASESRSTALGPSSNASGYNSIALGDYSIAKGAYSTALGYSSIASGDYSTALGRYSDAEGYYSTVLGAYSTASGNYSTVLGAYSTASEYRSTALGAGANAFMRRSTVAGVEDNVSGVLFQMMLVNDNQYADEPYIIFMHEDMLTASVEGVKISKTNFFVMLKQFGGEDFTESSQGGASS